MKWLIKIAVAILESQKFRVYSPEQIKIEAEQLEAHKESKAISLLKDKGYIVYPKTKYQKKLK